jgi:hypothetical protein
VLLDDCFQAYAVFFFIIIIIWILLMLEAWCDCDDITLSIHEVMNEILNGSEYCMHRVR